MSLVYEAQNLRQAYGGLPALQISAFRLEKGDALILQGPNGSGKSTFLRLLAFLEKPSGGSLRYFGGREPRRECTLLLQEPWLLHATVFQNVVLGLKLRGIRQDLRASYEAAMRASGFDRPEAYALRRPAALSGGEKQRVALAARLALKPVVLLLDEPTAYVDSRSAACILDALRAAHQAGLTIVCASHDPGIAQALGAATMAIERPDSDTRFSGQA
ncbi:MAG: ABC transporter ATP-binding protein [Desulfovibrio sp.]|nr:ABC transporter ATP-binding protein [Desulfovibrio sp.]